MWSAWDRAPSSEDDESDRNHAWSVMLAAAPQPPQTDAEQSRDSVIDLCAKAADTSMLNCGCAANIRALKSQQDAAIESKQAESSAPFGDMETMKRLELANAQLSQQVQMLKRTASGPELLERLATSQEPLGTEFSDVLKKNLWDLYIADPSAPESQALVDISNGQWAEVHKVLAEKTLAQVREILTDSAIPHVAVRVCQALEKIDLIIPNSDATTGESK
jgi:hypothetical protein